MKVLDLLGVRSGNLVVQMRVKNSPYGQSMWQCLCDCGKKTFVPGTNIKNKTTKSCGCLNAKRIWNLNRTHAKTKSREYNSWRGMKERCDNPKNSHYPFYGERGISYSEEWKSFEKFYSDMGNCPENYQLDRVNVNLDYSQQNCRWVDKTVQAYNIRKKKNNTSGRTGVYKNKDGKFSAVITVYKKVIYLGVFYSFEEACLAREIAELKYYGISKE